MDEQNNLTEQSNLPEQDTLAGQNNIPEQDGLTVPESTNSESDSIVGSEDPIVIPALPEPPKKSAETKGSKFASFLGILILVLGVGALGFFGIRTLLRKNNTIKQAADQKVELEKGQWMEIPVCYAKYFGEIKHSVNFIPTAYEYYYIAVTMDESGYVLFRADKDWLDGRFDADGYALDENGVLVTGYVRKADYKVTNEAKDVVGLTFSGNPELFVDVLATRISVYEIILFALPILALIIFYLISKDVWDLKLDSGIGKAVVAVFTVGGIAYGCFLIHVLALVLL